jgi:hypothetical protein
MRLGQECMSPGFGELPLERSMRLMTGRMEFQVVLD